MPPREVRVSRREIRRAFGPKASEALEACAQSVAALTEHQSQLDARLTRLERSRGLLARLKALVGVGARG